MHLPITLAAYLSATSPTATESSLGIDGPAPMIAIAAGLLAAAALGVAAALGQRPSRWHILVTTGAAGGFLVYAIAALLQWAGDGAPESPVVFGFYLVATLLMIPAAIAWARSEPSRWSIVVLAVVCLVMPVLVVRLEQVWSGV